MSSDGTTNSDGALLAGLIQEASDTFFEELSRRLNLGAEQYGNFKFLEKDTLQEAMDELVDLANYAMFTYVKLHLLQVSIANSNLLPEDSHGFIKASEFGWKSTKEG